MTSEFLNFTARLREFIQSAEPRTRNPEHRSHLGPAVVGCDASAFNELARELFRLQFAHNAPYRRLCEVRGVSPQNATRWAQIPAVPTAAFKELELSCLPVEERTTVFYSSGTTGQRRSRHFHNAESLAVYEASLLPWFRAHVLPDSRSPIADSRLAIGDWRLAILTPPPTQAPHSSLVHMFETVRRALGAPGSAFVGTVGGDGAWRLDLEVALEVLQAARAGQRPLVLLGTAFSFVHLLDHLAEEDLRFNLPAGSRAMETGGYKGRSRILPKAELHALLTEWLGIPPTHIVCEYGMSELSSQAYDHALDATRNPQPAIRLTPHASRRSSSVTRHFVFPPWARAQIVSPETGLEVAEGETGLIRVFDLANVFSAMAIQTEDLGVRRGAGFDLIGRVEAHEPRGCSLLTA